MSREATLPTMDEIHTGFLDHKRWAESTLPVRAKSGALIPYVLQPAQLKLCAAIEKCRKGGRPARIIDAKARQVMVSTFIAGYFFQKVAFTAGQNATVVAHAKKNAEAIFSYYHTFQQGYRPYRDIILQPRLISNSRRELKWANGSRIKVDTAKNIESGRSSTERFLHLSEYAFYDHAAEFMTGLMQSVPNDPDTCVVVESTANGLGNAFHRLCTQATDPAQLSEWVLVFSAWWEHPEYAIGVPGDRREFTRSLDDEEQMLAGRFGVSLEQLAWRRWCIRNNCESDLQRFHQEYPAYLEEAFIASGRPRFDLQALNRMPIVREAPLVGGLEEEKFATKRRFFFIPRERGELTVYRKPEKGHLYVIGADSAEGIDANEGEGTPDPDFASAQVLDIASGEQTAKLRARMEPAEFGRYVVSLARWYYDAFLVPERNNTGIATIEEILREGYPTGLIYQHLGEPASLDIEGARTSLQKLGWRTTSTSRPQLVSKLDRSIRELAVIIRDAHTLWECQTFVIKPNGRAEHQQGCHDDDVLALALAVVGIEAYPATKRRDNETARLKRYARRGELPSEWERELARRRAAR